MRRARVVVALSDSIERAVGEVAQDVTTVRGCSFIPDQGLIAARDAAASERQPVIVTSGYRTSIYQFEGVITMFEQLVLEVPEARLEIYGYGDTDEVYWQTVLAAAAKNSSISIVNDASHEAFLGALSTARAYVRNTTHDAYGVAVAEALFLGGNAVATDVCERAPGTMVYEVGDTCALLALTKSAFVDPPPAEVLADDGIDGYRDALALLLPQ